MTKRKNKKLACKLIENFRQRLIAGRLQGHYTGESYKRLMAVADQAERMPYEKAFYNLSMAAWARPEQPYLHVGIDYGTVPPLPSTKP